MARTLKIGTRESELAVWQATTVQGLLAEQGVLSELVYVKSEGDIDLVTPLYAMGVQGVFTKTLDAALLNERIDIAVHSMKDVPTVLPVGISQAAVLKRASYKDLFVFNSASEIQQLDLAGPAGNAESVATIATSSIRRKAQWLGRYPKHNIENLRGNVNTRMQKVSASTWAGAIFAAAGLERINLRPENSIELDWMLPAPAQGAIMVVCREADTEAFVFCKAFNDDDTALCTAIEREFLSTLLGGCSTPISALAEIKDGTLHFQANIGALDGSQLYSIEKKETVSHSRELGRRAANELLEQPQVQSILQQIRNAAK
jgi:hydroxymethylbilane synthase